MVVFTIDCCGQGPGCSSFKFSANRKLNTRKKIGVIRLCNVTKTDSDTKRANLSAARKGRIKLPTYDDYWFSDKRHHISEFLSHKSGIEAMLNKSAFQSFQFLDSNTYRCTLPKVKLLNFEAAPTLDLRVTPTDEDCSVELLSCRFEGSEAVERQNNHFSAFMTNHMRWETNGSESFLEIDAKLDLSLEIYTRPFTMMPVAAVERPGNLMLQALLDKLVPLMLRQLVQDYDKWIHQQLEQHTIN